MSKKDRIMQAIDGLRKAIDLNEANENSLIILIKTDNRDNNDSNVFGARVIEGHKDDIVDLITTSLERDPLLKDLIIESMMGTILKKNFE